VHLTPYGGKHLTAENAENGGRDEPHTAQRA
jgi:hypothetical protein